MFLVPLLIMPLAFSLARIKGSLQVEEDTAPVAAPKAKPTPRATLGQSFSRLGVVNMAASRDGRSLYTLGLRRGASASHSIDVWDARTYVHQRSFGVQATLGSPLRLSPDGKILYYVASGMMPVLLNISSGGSLWPGIQRGDGFFHAVLGRDVWAMPVGNSINLRSPRRGHFIRSVPSGAGSWPRGLCSSPDGSLLAWIANHQSADKSRNPRSNSTTADGLAVYSLSLKRRVFARALPEHDIDQVVISGDNAKLIALADHKRPAPSNQAPPPDRKLLVFDLKSGHLLTQRSLGWRNGTSLTASPDGKWLVLTDSDSHYPSSVSSEGWMEIISLSGGRSTAIQEGSSKHAIAFSANSREMFLASSGRRLKLKPDGWWQEAPL